MQTNINNGICYFDTISSSIQWDILKGPLYNWLKCRFDFFSYFQLKIKNVTFISPRCWVPSSSAGWPLNTYFVFCVYIIIKLKVNLSYESIPVSKVRERQSAAVWSIGLIFFLHHQTTALMLTNVEGIHITNISIDVFI